VSEQEQKPAEQQEKITVINIVINPITKERSEHTYEIPRAIPRPGAPRRVDL